MRKRRRQQYHAMMLARPKKKSAKKVKKTLDGGAWQEPLKEPRRVFTIQQKLEVLDMYQGLFKERKKAEELSREPKPMGGSAADIAAWKERRKIATQQAKIPILKKVKAAFPNLVKGSPICKWLKASKAEKWRDLPEMVKARCSATRNEWRKKLGLPLKGKSLGGKIPMLLQVELDRLMTEMSSGASGISERKEIVTTEHVVSCPHHSP